MLTRSLSQGRSLASPASGPLAGSSAALLPLQNYVHVVVVGTSEMCNKRDKLFTIVIIRINQEILAARHLDKSMCPDARATFVKCARGKSRTCRSFPLAPPVSPRPRVQTRAPARNAAPAAPSPDPLLYL
jgi:hypothetical protein